MLFYSYTRNRVMFYSSRGMFDMALGNGLRLPSITPTRLVLLFSLALVALYNLATWEALGTLITLQGAHKLAFSPRSRCFCGPRSPCC